MNPKYLSCLVALLVMLLSREGFGEEKVREFKSSDGRSLSAKLLDLEGEKAKLLLATGRTTLVPLSRLSEGDQNYVKDWAKRNKSTLKLGAIVMAFDRNESVSRPDKEEKERNKKAKIEVKRRTTTSYEMEITNTTSETIDDVEVYFRIYKQVNENSGRGVIKEMVPERWDLGSLEAKATEKNETEEVEAVDMEAEKRKQSEKTVGMMADVVVGGVLYQRFSYPDNTESYVRDNFKSRGEEFVTPDYWKGRGGGGEASKEEEVD